MHAMPLAVPSDHAKNLGAKSLMRCRTQHSPDDILDACSVHQVTLQADL